MPINRQYRLKVDSVYMSAGAYQNPVVSDKAGDTFRELWAKCTGAGHVYGYRVNIQVTNIAATSSNAIRAELELLHASGHAVSGGSGLHAAAEIGADNDGHAGLLAGLNASIIAALDTRSLQGTYCALSCQTEFKAGNTMPAGTSHIRFTDAGAVRCPQLFDLQGLTANAAGAVQEDSGSVSTIYGYARVRCPDGTQGYLVIYAAHN